MLKLITFFQSWFAAGERTDEDRGATMVEYALIVSLIALVAATGVALFGTALSNFFSGLNPAG
jgi:pilus assembly protein Flp/PilA